MAQGEPLSKLIPDQCAVADRKGANGNQRLSMCHAPVHLMHNAAVVEMIGCGLFKQFEQLEVGE